MAGMAVNVPPPLSLDGNVSQNWTRFHYSFEIYIGACGREKDEAEITAMEAAAKSSYYNGLGKLLLNVAGEEATAVASTLGLAEASKFDYRELVKKFGEYAKTEINDTYERFIFNSCIQQEGESFDHFVTELRKKAKHCGYGDQEDSFIRDRIIVGMRNKKMQEALFRTRNLTLDQTIKDCRAAEQSKQYSQELNNGNPTTIALTDAVKITKKYDKKKKEFKCSKCGYNHEYAKCPAYGKQCIKCKEIGHFQTRCPLIKRTEVHEVKVDNNPDYEIYYCDSISTDNEGRPTEYIQAIKVEEGVIEFKLDPGAQKSILPLADFEGLKSQKALKPTVVQIKPFGKETPSITNAGIVDLVCSINGVKKSVRFLVTDKADRALLGINDCEDFKLITRNPVLVSEVQANDQQSNFLKINEDVFQGLGKFPGQHPIIIKQDAEQVIRPALRKPSSVNEKLKPCLESLEKRSIIEKVEHLSSDCWVSNLVIVTKPTGDIRLCIDPTDLNKVIIREPYIIPSIPELAEKINHKKYYSLFDLKDGFYHIELDKESQNKCCFATPFGIYKFLRCPFGLASAPELFQKLNEEVFGDIPNVITYFDDVLACGKTEAEHDEAVRMILERARAKNVKFNPKKLQYKKLEVKYIGHVFCHAGMRLDPDRVKGLMELETPTNRDQLASILGMFNYVRSFIPDYTKVTKILYDLKKNDVIWNWTDAHAAVYNELKRRVSGAPVLANFDPSIPILIQSDASQFGIGCCLLQNKHPVAFASRSLSPSEVNYSVSEKEMLAICFATEKFHNMIFGYPVQVQTDHKPLIPMFQKEIHKIGSRTLQRLRLKLVKYTLQVHHIPGKEMYVADLLSRSHNKDPVNDDPSMTEVVHTVTTSLLISGPLQKDIVSHTQQDDTLQRVIHHIRKGWPTTVTQLSDSLIPYFKIRDQLFYEDNILFYNHEDATPRIIVPGRLRKNILALVHKGHMGIDKNNWRAKSIFHWPNMGDHMATFVKECSTCAKVNPMPRRQPLCSRELPELPWQRISMDIASYAGKDYLILYDALSKWIEIVKIPSKSSAAVINTLKSIFSTHGFPSTVDADNNPFNSFEFKTFARNSNFEVVTSSPHFPRSNGRAEKGVNIAKGIIKKCHEDKTDLRDSLREYRNTVVPSMGASPAQLLFSRQLKSILPVSKQQLKPEVQTGVLQKLEEQQKRTEAWYNKSAKRKEIEFKQGDRVVVKISPQDKGTIVSVKEKLQEPRSYIVGDGLRRTTQHLRLVSNKPTGEESEPDEFDYDFRPQPPTVIPSQKDVDSRTEASDPSSEEVEEPEYQLIVPDWLYDMNYKTLRGRTVVAPKRFPNY